MQEINIGLIGFGTVGSGLAQVLYEQAEQIEKRVGAVIRLKTVADIMVDTLPDHIAQGGRVTLTRDANEIFHDPEISIVVELIGGIEPAKSFMLKAFEKPVQTQPPSSCDVAVSKPRTVVPSSVTLYSSVVGRA